MEIKLACFWCQRPNGKIAIVDKTLDEPPNAIAIFEDYDACEKCIEEWGDRYLFASSVAATDDPYEISIEGRVPDGRGVLIPKEALHFFLNEDDLKTVIENDDRFIFIDPEFFELLSGRFTKQNKD